MIHVMAFLIHGMERKVPADTKIKAAKGGAKPHKLTDAEQLYLYVTPTGGRFWRMNYTFGTSRQGRPAQKTLSLGEYPKMILSGARAERDKVKELLRQGKDPAVEKRLAKHASIATHADTFEKLARLACAEGRRLECRPRQRRHPEPGAGRLPG